MAAKVKVSKCESESSSLLLQVHDGLVDLEVVGELRVLRHLDGVHAPVVARSKSFLDHLERKT